MPASVTFQCNLTHSDGDGSTITGATTSKTITPTAATSAQIKSLQAIDPAASGTFETVNLGDVAVTQEHAIRFRNAGFSSSTGQGVAFIELAIQTGASTFVVLQRLYAGEMCMPGRMIGQTSAGSPYPRYAARAASTANSATASGNAAMNLEVSACDLGTPTS